MNARLLGLLSPKRSAAVMCGVGLVLVILGRITTDCGGVVVGTGIMVVGAVAALYGMVFVMLYGFATIRATVASVVHMVRRKPPTDDQPGEDE
jgi:hypothetical protein